MRPVLAYLLLVATLLPTFSQWGTIAYYHANKDYIAKVLCENRAKPQLHCDGKCYLAKKLTAQQEQQDKATTERVLKTPDFQLFFQLTLPFCFRQVSVGTVTKLPTYLLKNYSSPRSHPFQPPRV
ncbi:hypothetical protein LX87_02560 [Larkinella arboricola]|uniref:Uncharacterized protein n=1 Tax=Larkinella arboricola TaxID=643671 RepID=A0A327WWG5_LARAB|nr:hypothetical protein [Larkinella arboricola]RAJ97657.1 hypothetical protein LX87_02560 [Larkinella arboricola]